MRLPIFDPTAKVPIPYIPMLTQEQYDQLLSNYSETIVDGMDMDSLVQFAIEQIEENIRRNCPTDVELVEEMSRFYEEDEVATMLEDVGANPEDFDIGTSEDELTEEQIKFLQDSVKKEDIN